jgi:hypothetical protein
MFQETAPLSAPAKWQAYQSTSRRSEKVVSFQQFCGRNATTMSAPWASLTQRREGSILVLLVIASGIAGFLLGRFFRGYAVVPATILIMVPAGYLGHEQGFATGMTAFVVSAMVMQVFYFAIVVTSMLIESLSVIDRVQSEASPQLPESRTAF